MDKGINQNKIQDLNRSLLIKLLRKEKVCSRSDLSKLSGLRKATVSNIVNDLIDVKLVKEVGLIKNDRGRRSIGLSINKDLYRTIAVRITRQSYSVALFDLQNKMQEFKKIEIKKENGHKIIKKISKTINKIINNNSDYKILMIAAAIPGPFKKDKEKIILMSGFPGWKNVSIQKELQKNFDIPVLTEHDANLGAYDQLWINNDIEENDTIVYIAAGQGIGAGILINGDIFKGESGFAGEIGHTSIDYNGHSCECGNKGCLEKYCSSLVLIEKINKRLGKNLNFEQIVDLIKENNPTCLNVYKEICKYLGIGIVNVINTINPKKIIIGDDLTHIKPELMLSSIKKVFKERLIKDYWDNLDISITDTEKDSILYGASDLAITQIFENLENIIK